MNSQKETFLIALDSSVLNDISRDYFHKDQAKQQSAKNVINSLYNFGGILVITWHHLEEILAHKNDTIVSNSIKFIQNLPLVASLKSPNHMHFTGSILNIETEEINNLLDHNNDNLKSTIMKTKANIFHFCSGQELLEPFLDVQNILRNRILNKVNVKREIVSISRAQSLNANNMKLSDLKTGKMNSPEKRALIVEYMKHNLINEIRERGDKKIKSAEVSATNFLSSIFDNNDESFDSSSLLQKLFLEPNNITNEEFEKLKNWEEFKYLSIFKKRMITISENFPDTKRKSTLKLEEGNCPTWLLWKELYKIRVKAERVSGSDINDAFLAGLILYVDLTIVDKRTYEYLLQIKRKNTKLKSLMGKFEKLSHYSDILDDL